MEAEPIVVETLETFAPPSLLPPDGPPPPLHPPSPPYPPALLPPLGGAPPPEPPAHRHRKRDDVATSRRQLSIVEIEPSESNGGTKQRLVAFFVDEAERLTNTRPPGRLIGHYAKTIGGLVDEGMSPRTIALGLRRQCERGVFSPAKLGAMALEAARAETKPSRLTAADLFRMAAEQ